MSLTYSPAKLSLVIWFSALIFGAQQMNAANVTYIVGTCKSGTHFSTFNLPSMPLRLPTRLRYVPGSTPSRS